MTHTAMALAQSMDYIYVYCVHMYNRENAQKPFFGAGGRINRTLTAPLTASLDPLPLPARNALDLPPPFNLV